MSELMVGAAVLLMLALAIGLWRSVVGPTLPDRLLAIQLLGTGGAALCVLFMAAFENPDLLDIALVISLLAAVGAVALTRHNWQSQIDDDAGSTQSERGDGS